MEFGRYFSGSYIDTDALTAFWTYPATTSGDFTLNHPTGVSPTVQQIISLSDQDDFTLFLTIDTGIVTTPENLKFRTQILASNATGGGGGWDFGLLASNFFFISCPNGEIYTFNQIHLGAKNCFCLKKSGQSFTVFKYDVYSQDIESEQTVFFSSLANLNGNDILVGYNINSDINATHYSWYGTVDQLALINEPLDRATIKNLFVGFEPKTLNVTTTYSDYLLDSVWRPVSIPDLYTGLVTPLINDVKNYVFGLNSGNYISSFSGNVSSSFSGSGYFVTGVDLCYGSGGSNLFSYNSSSGVVAGMSGSGWMITDLIRANSYVAGISGAQTNEVLITHNFRVFYNSGEWMRFDYDSIYEKNKPSYSTGVSVDTDYYSGFYMNGVSQNNYYYNSILLGDITGAIPTGVNILGKFDQVSGLFTVLEQSGYYFYNGIRVSGSNLSLDGEYIDVLSVAEVDSDRLIYDLYSGLRLQFFGLQGFATGSFYPRTSTPYTGVNSYSPMYRNLPENYYETSKLHMFHGQPVLHKDDNEEFNNMDDYWT